MTKGIDAGTVRYKQRLVEAAEGLRRSGDEEEDARGKTGRQGPEGERRGKTSDKEERKGAPSGRLCRTAAVAQSPPRFVRCSTNIAGPQTGDIRADGFVYNVDMCAQLVFNACSILRQILTCGAKLELCCLRPASSSIEMSHAGAKTSSQRPRRPGVESSGLAQLPLTQPLFYICCKPED